MKKRKSNSYEIGFVRSAALHCLDKVNLCEDEEKRRQGFSETVLAMDGVFAVTVQFISEDYARKLAEERKQ